MMCQTSPLLRAGFVQRATEPLLLTSGTSCEVGDLFFGSFSLAFIALSYRGTEQRVVLTILG